VPAVTDTGDGVVVITMPANPFVLSMKPGILLLYSKGFVMELDNPAD
jgi:hypothetical protein